MAVFVLRWSPVGQKNEGWFDPWLYLQAFRKKIISMGVTVIEAEITGLNIMDNMVQETKVRNNSVNE